MYLEIRGLSKFFTLHLLGGKRIAAFSDVGFQLKGGEFLGVMGPIGTGKSSLMKCLYRTYLPSEGEVLIHLDGKTVDLAKAPDYEIIALRRGEIGFVSQTFRKVPRVTTLDIVAEPLLEQGVGLTDAREKAKDMLARFLIPQEVWDTYPANLGIGEAQRVNFARAFVYNPRLLILDEPTSLLDAQTIEIIVEMFRELKDHGVAIIGAFQENDIIRELADQVLLMEKNRVSALGKTEEILRLVQHKKNRQQGNLQRRGPRTYPERARRS